MAHVTMPKPASLSEHMCGILGMMSVCVSVCSGWSSSSYLLEVKIIKVKQYCNHDHTMHIDSKSRAEITVCSLRLNECF